MGKERPKTQRRKVIDLQRPRNIKQVPIIEDDRLHGFYLAHEKQRHLRAARRQLASQKPHRQIQVAERGKTGFVTRTEKRSEAKILRQKKVRNPVKQEKRRALAERRMPTSTEELVRRRKEYFVSRKISRKELLKVRELFPELFGEYPDFLLAVASTEVPGRTVQQLFDFAERQRKELEEGRGDHNTAHYIQINLGISKFILMNDFLNVRGMPPTDEELGILFREVPISHPANIEEYRKFEEKLVEIRTRKRAVTLQSTANRMRAFKAGMDRIKAYSLTLPERKEIVNKARERYKRGRKLKEVIEWALWQALRMHNSKLRTLIEQKNLQKSGIIQIINGLRVSPAVKDEVVYNVIKSLERNVTSDAIISYIYHRAGEGVVETHELKPGGGDRKAVQIVYATQALEERAAFIADMATATRGSSQVLEQKIRKIEKKYGGALPVDFFRRVRSAMQGRNKVGELNDTIERERRQLFGRMKQRVATPETGIQPETPRLEERRSLADLATHEWAIGRVFVGRSIFLQDEAWLKEIEDKGYARLAEDLANEQSDAHKNLQRRVNYAVGKNHLLNSERVEVAKLIVEALITFSKLGRAGHIEHQTFVKRIRGKYGGTKVDRRIVSVAVVDALIEDKVLIPYQGRRQAKTQHSYQLNYTENDIRVYYRQNG